LLKNLIKKLLFPFSIIFVASLAVNSFYKFSNKNIDNGFVNATPLRSNKYFCESNNYVCVENIINDLNNSKNNILLFGNSQLGAINQFSEGEINYAQELSSKVDKYSNGNYLVRSIWLTNAKLAEFELIYSALKECSTRIDNIIIPVFLDDTREEKVRDSLVNYSHKICGKFKNFKNKQNDSQKLINKSNSGRIDDFIINKVWLFDNARSLNSKFRIFLYKLRNYVFGIKASSKRKIVPNAYFKNINSLKRIISLRESENTLSIIYIPPILHYSSGKPIPYFKNEYEDFKIEISDICNSKYCKYFVLESVIEDQLWGYKGQNTSFLKNEELDFMHFTYLGHKVMSKKLLKILNNFILLK